jgi:ABC-type glutathione transport system ATPase component
MVKPRTSPVVESVAPASAGATSRDSAQLAICGLWKTYHTEAGEVHALRGIDLDLSLGELVVMLGPSGSGKSTLLNILGGPDVPTAGQVTYAGRDLERSRNGRCCSRRGTISCAMTCISPGSTTWLTTKKGWPSIALIQ